MMRARNDDGDEALSTGGNERNWWAIVGVEPTPAAGGVAVTAHDKTRRLGQRVGLGPVTLRPGGDELIEYRRGTPHALDGWDCYQSWPIIVEGQSSADYSLEFDHQAAAQVRRTAALVALAWREPWQVRAAPRDRERMTPRIPESDQPPKMWLSEPLGLSPTDAVVPDWLNVGWLRMDREPVIARALLAWHEALLVQSAHPTLSLVSYTAAVEALSESTWAQAVLPEIEDEPCPTCHRGGGPSRRRVVQEMIECVASPAVLEVLQPWYSRRSAHVHAGRHYGTEMASGSVFDLGPRMALPNLETLVGDSEAQEFVLRLVPTARAVTTQLLELCLRNAEPSPLGGVAVDEA